MSNRIMLQGTVANLKLEHKEWWVMLGSVVHDHSIIKLQEDSND